ncbi:MAG: hypothetical protein DRJ64_00625 [Thermoprotei archaeon]|nr:MAG: hypothetical protein DRJ64_00625 [Thermoprotei archaeon]
MSKQDLDVELTELTANAKIITSQPMRGSWDKEGEKKEGEKKDHNLSPYRNKHPQTNKECWYIPGGCWRAAAGCLIKDWGEKNFFYIPNKRRGYGEWWLYQDEMCEIMEPEIIDRKIIEWLDEQVMFTDNPDGSRNIEAIDTDKDMARHNVERCLREMRSRKLIGTIQEGEVVIKKDTVEFLNRNLLFLKDYILDNSILLDNRIPIHEALSQSIIKYSPKWFTRHKCDLSLNELITRRHQPTPHFDYLINRCFDDRNRDLLLQYVGFIIYGAPRDMKRFLYIYGKGNTGKTTIFNYVLGPIFGKVGVIGEDWRALTDTFSRERWGETKLLMFPEAMTNSDRAKGEVERIKQITGGDPIPVEAKFGARRSVYLNLKIIIYGNIGPTMQDSSGALHNRMILVKSTDDVIENAMTPIEAENAYKGEIAAIAYRAIEWARRAYTDKFSQNQIDPKSISPIHALLYDLFEIRPKDWYPRSKMEAEKVRLTKKILFEIYKNWAVENKTGTWSYMNFCNHLDASDLVKYIRPKIGNERLNPGYYNLIPKEEWLQNKITDNFKK